MTIIIVMCIFGACVGFTVGQMVGYRRGWRACGELGSAAGLRRLNAEKWSLPAEAGPFPMSLAARDARRMSSPPPIGFKPIPTPAPPRG